MGFYRKGFACFVFAVGAFLLDGCVGSRSQSQEQEQGENNGAYRRPSREDCPSVAGLKRYVFEKKKNNRTNHFSALEVQSADQPVEIWLYWREGRSFIFLHPHPPSDPIEEANRISLSKSLDLAQSVVETQADVGSSTYLVTREWAEKIKRQFQSQGIQLIIAPFSKLETDDS